MSTNDARTKVANANIETLKHNSYPGRGIVVGSTANGDLVQIYWIMGRSANSRNRVFIVEGDDVATKAADPAALVDPSLIIYYPIRVRLGVHIVSNGDQTDTVCEAFESGGWWPEEIPSRFAESLRSRTYEPDPPHFTPRISAVVSVEAAKKTQRGEGGWAYALSILKSTEGVENAAQRNSYVYDRFLAGFGHLLHTYEGDGNRLPSFFGEPRIVPVKDDPEENLSYYWNLLDADNRVSMAVKHIRLSTGKSTLLVQNKFSAK